MTPATSSSLGGSVGNSLFALGAIPAQESPRIPPTLDLPSPGTLRPSAIVWAMAVITVRWTHETENRQWDTQQRFCSLQWNWPYSDFRIPLHPRELRAMPWAWRPFAWVVAMCRRATLSIWVDYIPLPPSLQKKKSSTFMMPIMENIESTKLSLKATF